MRLQVLGGRQQQAGLSRHRAAATREEIRQRWARERIRIFKTRDALTVGLGWPHRGEPVTTWYYGSGGEKASVTGAPGVYLNAYGIFGVTHEVWLPSLSASHREATLIVAWTPSLGDGSHGNAGPARGISMRVTAAGSRPLPVPPATLPICGRRRRGHRPPAPRPARRPTRALRVTSGPRSRALSQAGRAGGLRTRATCPDCW